MTWTEGVLRISENFEIHGGYLGIIVCSIYAIAIILFILFVGAVGGMIGDTIKEVSQLHPSKEGCLSKG